MECSRRCWPVNSIFHLGTWQVDTVERFFSKYDACLQEDVTRRDMLHTSNMQTNSCFRCNTSLNYGTKGKHFSEHITRDQLETALVEE